MISTKILEPWWKKVLFMEAVTLQRASTLCTLHMKSWTLSVHLSPRGLQKGGNSGKSATTSPRRQQIRNGLCPEHPGYVVEVQEERGSQHQQGEDRERKRCHMGKTAYGCLHRVLLSGPCYCVSLSATPPPLSLPKASTFLRGSELLTNLGKMLWKTLSTKTNLNS